MHIERGVRLVGVVFKDGAIEDRWMRGIDLQRVGRSLIVIWCRWIKRCVEAFPMWPITWAGNMGRVVLKSRFLMSMILLSVVCARCGGLGWFPWGHRGLDLERPEHGGRQMLESRLNSTVVTTWNRGRNLGEKKTRV